MFYVLFAAVEPDREEALALLKQDCVEFQEGFLQKIKELSEKFDAERVKQYLHRDKSTLEDLDFMKGEKFLRQQPQKLKKTRSSSNDVSQKNFPSVRSEELTDITIQQGTVVDLTENDYLTNDHFGTNASKISSMDSLLPTPTDKKSKENDADVKLINETNHMEIEEFKLNGSDVEDIVV